MRRLSIYALLIFFILSACAGGSGGGIDDDDDGLAGGDLGAVTPITKLNIPAGAKNLMISGGVSAAVSANINGPSLATTGTGKKITTVIDGQEIEITTDGSGLSFSDVKKIDKGSIYKAWWKFTDDQGIAYNYVMDAIGNMTPVDFAPVKSGPLNNSPWVRQAAGKLYFLDAAGKINIRSASDVSYSISFSTAYNVTEPTGVERFAVADSGDVTYFTATDARYLESAGTDTTLIDNFTDRDYSVAFSPETRKLAFPVGADKFLMFADEYKVQAYWVYDDNGTINVRFNQYDDYDSFIQGLSNFTAMDISESPSACDVAVVGAATAAICGTSVYYSPDSSSDVLSKNLNFTVHTNTGLEIVASDTNLYLYSNIPDGTQGHRLSRVDIVNETNVLLIPEIATIPTTIDYKAIPGTFSVTTDVNDTISFCGTKISTGDQVIVTIDQADATPDISEILGTCEENVPLN